MGIFLNLISPIFQLQISKLISFPFEERIILSGWCLKGFEGAKRQSKIFFHKIFWDLFLESNDRIRDYIPELKNLDIIFFLWSKYQEVNFISNRIQDWNFNKKKYHFYYENRMILKWPVGFVSKKISPDILSWLLN